MAMVKNVVSFLVASVLFMTVTNAKTYTVGDGDGWKPGVDYKAWASGKTFKDRDILVFKYLEGEHDVQYVFEKQYDDCKIFRPIRYYGNGNGTAMVELYITSGSKMHFICGKKDHCTQGMKLAVSVTGSSYSDNSPTVPKAASRKKKPSNSAQRFSSAGSFALTFALMMLAAI